MWFFNGTIVYFLKVAIGQINVPQIGGYVSPSECWITFCWVKLTVEWRNIRHTSCDAVLYPNCVFNRFLSSCGGQWFSRRCESSTELLGYSISRTVLSSPRLFSLASRALCLSVAGCLNYFVAFDRRVHFFRVYRDVSALFLIQSKLYQLLTQVEFGGMISLILWASGYLEFHTFEAHRTRIVHLRPRKFINSYNTCLR